MKKLILAVCLVFMVGVGFAGTWFPKTIATSICIGTVYDDGKVKYALTEDEILTQIGHDYTFYFDNLIDYKRYGTIKIEYISDIDCMISVDRGDYFVRLRVYYFFDLTTYDCEGGISLKEKNTILNKLAEVTVDAWESLEDPIIDEIKKGM